MQKQKNNSSVNNQIEKFHAFLPEEIYREIYTISRNISWNNLKKLDGKFSNHFNKTIIDSEKAFEIERNCYRYIFEKVNKIYNANYWPHNFYFNLSQHGNECGIHSDRITKANNKTLIIYLTDFWSADWHGETMFYKENEKDIFTASIPFPNDAVIFDSNISHCVSPISKFCTTDRIVLVAQMEDK